MRLQLPRWLGCQPLYPRVILTDAALLPMQYTHIPHVALPGCFTFATL